MFRKKRLIKETVTLVERLGIDLSENLIQALRRSLSTDARGKADAFGSELCDLKLTQADIDQLVDELFDSETDFAPKGLRATSGKDAFRARQADSIARIIDEWNQEKRSDKIS